MTSFIPHLPPRPGKGCLTTPPRPTRVALGASLLMVTAIVAGGAPAGAVQATPGGAERTTRLTELLDAAPSPSSPITIEAITDDTTAARRQVIAAGGIITGAVEGEVLQVSIPAVRVARLDAASAIEFTRAPLTASRPITRTEFGPVVGEGVAAVNADDWHAAGITGAGVRVGIVDFFDLTLWNPAEHGPLPDLAHRFCLDGSGTGLCDSSKGASEHGVAVAEVVKDLAPDAELFLATVGTASDLRASIDWFVSNGISVMTRSLGAAYDGAGDGSGPLAATVEYATSKGLVWFNSAGNDAAGSYGRYVDGVDQFGYVDFLNGPGVDTTLGIRSSAGSPGGVTCLGLDGVRWSDFGESPGRVTDYGVEVLINGSVSKTINESQGAGAIPIEGQDDSVCATNSGTLELRIRRVSGGDADGDIIEVGTFDGTLEYSQIAYSAAKPVVDSRSPSLISVGAVDPPTGSTIAYYSSQGPTNDGRLKPDMSAPSCVTSTIYSPAVFGPGACFNGTSAAAPTAAGAAALILGRGLALPGVHLAALTKHLVADLGLPGPDTAFGTGKSLLPAPPPTAVDARPATYTAFAVPTRLLDTRPESSTVNARLGPHPQYSIIDVPVGVSGASAVAVSIVSVGNVAAGYVQAVPTLLGQLGSSSNLNVATPGQVQPNFAIVPVGANNSISLYLFAGGNVVVDIMGFFTPVPVAAGIPPTPPAPPGPPVPPGAPGPPATAAAGRFVAVAPQRVLDTRPESSGPVPPEWVAHKPLGGETVRITGIPAGASAAVVNVVADQATGAGYLRTQPTGASGLTTSNGNYTAGLASGTLSIVPVGPDGSISVFTNTSTHIVADLMGYITGPTAEVSATGLFVPIAPGRAYDSRIAAGPHLTLTARPVQITGLTAPAIPASASAVSMNLTSDLAAGAGFLTVFPADQSLPLISNLNYPATQPRANAGMVRLAASGTLTTFVNQTTHVIVDVNGYFTG